MIGSSVKSAANLSQLVLKCFGNVQKEFGSAPFSMSNVARLYLKARTKVMQITKLTKSELKNTEFEKTEPRTGL